MSFSHPHVAARSDAFATVPWQVLGLVAANYVWTRGLAGPSTASPLADSAPDDLAPLVVMSTVGIAVLEEFVFRGALFAWLRERLGLAAAILGSALLFAAFHAPPRDALVALLLGLQLGALREGLGLGTAITAHVTSNLAFLAIAVSPSSAEMVRHPVVLAAALAIAGSACAALAQRVRSRTR